MEPLITELKRAREAKGLTLADIADATLINLRFLEELESGNFVFLPQTYVRAFLREYALQVGLDPDEMTRMYDDFRKSPSQIKEQKDQKSEPLPVPIPVAQPSAAPVPSPGIPPPEPGTRTPEGPAFGKLALGSILAIGIAVVIWNLLTADADRTMEETPFDSVIKEHEIQGTGGDSASSPAPGKDPVSTDSLILQATTLDTVWIQIVTDNGTPKDYMIRPNVTRTWKAGEEFRVTVGNASSVEFRLNNTLLGRLGKPGAVVRNVQLTRSDVKK